MVFGVSETIWSLRNPILKFFYAKMTLTDDPPLLIYLRDMPLLTQTDSESQNEEKSRKLQLCAHIDYEVQIMKISFDFPKSICFKG